MTYDPNNDPRLSVGERAELDAYQRGTYADNARKVDRAMRHQDLPCVDGECDDEETCRRHERTFEIASLDDERARECTFCGAMFRPWWWGGRLVRDECTTCAAVFD